MDETKRKVTKKFALRERLKGAGSVETVVKKLSEARKNEEVLTEIAVQTRQVQLLSKKKDLLNINSGK